MSLLELPGARGADRATPPSHEGGHSHSRTFCQEQVGPHQRVGVRRQPPPTTNHQLRCQGRQWKAAQQENAQEVEFQTCHQTSGARGEGQSRPCPASGMPLSEFLIPVEALAVAAAAPKASWMLLQLNHQSCCNLGVTPPWGCNQPIAQKAECLVRIALWSPKPPSTRGSVAASRIPTSHCSKLTPRILSRHHHKPLSFLVANSSTTSSLTTPSKKFAHAWAQSDRRSHADCTSPTRGIRAKNLSCSSDTSLKCSVATSEPRQTRALVLFC